MNAIDWFKKRKFDFVVGVPCSEIKQFIKHVDTTIGYVPATREDEAIGIAFGAWLAGKKPLVFMQNSGFLMCGNAILSLLKPYGASITLLITIHDKAPQHKYATESTRKVLKAIDYNDYVLVQNEEIIR